jgi:hypothetical protein
LEREEAKNLQYTERHRQTKLNEKIWLKKEKKLQQLLEQEKEKIKKMNLQYTERLEREQQNLQKQLTERLQREQQNLQKQSEREQQSLEREKQNLQKQLKYREYGFIQEKQKRELWVTKLEKDLEKKEIEIQNLKNIIEIRGSHYARELKRK